MEIDTEAKEEVYARCDKTKTAISNDRASKANSLFLEFLIWRDNRGYLSIEMSYKSLVHHILQSYFN